MGRCLHPGRDVEHQGVLAEAGSDDAQAGTLFHLLKCGGSTVSALGDGLGVSNAAASQMLERLVQQGYVLRTEDLKTAGPARSRSHRRARP